MHTHTHAYMRAHTHTLQLTMKNTEGRAIDKGGTPPNTKKEGIPQIVQYDTASTIT